MSPTMLSVGLDPTMFPADDTTEASGSTPDHDTIMAGAEISYTKLRSLGFTIVRCLVDRGETAETVYRQSLAEQSFDYIAIGAGIRMDPELSYLFEMLVNTAIEVNPHATLVFDTGPATKADAVLRWFPRQGRA